MTLEELSGNRIDWSEVIRDVNHALIWFREHQIRPALRTMFYRLVHQRVRFLSGDNEEAEGRR